MNCCRDARQQERIRIDWKPSSSAYIQDGNNKIKKKIKKKESRTNAAWQEEKKISAASNLEQAEETYIHCFIFHSCSAESAEDVRMNNSKAQKQCLKVPKTVCLALCLQPELSPEKLVLLDLPSVEKGVKRRGKSRFKKCI